MRFLVILAALLLCRLSLAADLAVDIEVKWETKPKNGGYTAKFSGTTNLPPESSLRVTLGAANSSSGPGGSSECKVWSDGTFFTGYYGPFPAGKYEVKVDFEPRSQKPAVQSFTGSKGESLTGDLATPMKIGNFEWKMARKTTTLRLGDEAAANVATADKAAKTRDIATRILTLRELLADIYNRKDESQWIAFAREYTKRRGAIGDEIKPAGAVNQYPDILKSHVALHNLFNACLTKDPVKVAAADAEFRAAAAPLLALVEPDPDEGDNSGTGGRPVAVDADSIEALRAEIEKLEADKKEHARLDNRGDVQRLAKHIRDKKTELNRRLREQGEAAGSK